MEDNLKPVASYTFSHRKKMDDLSLFVELATEKFLGVAIMFTDNETMVVGSAGNPQIQGDDLIARANEVTRAANNIDRRYLKNDMLPPETSLNSLFESGLDRLHEPPARHRQIDRDYGWM